MPRASLSSLTDLRPRSALATVPSMMLSTFPSSVSPSRPPATVRGPTWALEVMMAPAAMALPPRATNSARHAIRVAKRGRRDRAVPGEDMCVSFREGTVASGQRWWSARWVLWGARPRFQPAGRPAMEHAAELWRRTDLGCGRTRTRGSGGPGPDRRDERQGGRREKRDEGVLREAGRETSWMDVAVVLQVDPGGGVDREAADQAGGHCGTS